MTLVIVAFCQLNCKDPDCVGHLLLHLFCDMEERDIHIPSARIKIRTGAVGSVSSFAFAFEYLAVHMASCLIIIT